MGKLNKNLMAAAAAGMLMVSGASSAVTFSDGGTGLQTLLNTTMGAGAPDVLLNQMEDSADSYWNFGLTSGSLQVILGENTPNAANNSFGLFSGGSLFEVFNGSDVAGYKAILTYDSLTNQIGVDIKDGILTIRSSAAAWTGNPFGFYLNNGSNIFYSDSAMNGGGIDAMVGFLDTPYPGESVLAFEDGTDEGSGFNTDYDDFVVVVESVYPVSAPATLAMLGLGLLGMGYRARRKSA